MGRRSRRRAKQAGEGPAAPGSSTGYADAEGNILSLRDDLSAGTRAKLEALDAKPAASAEDRWQRRTEFLFERLAVRWEISGLPLDDQSCSAATGWRVRMSGAGCARCSTSTCAH